jgi:hypothetical protein
MIEKKVKISDIMSKEEYDKVKEEYEKDEIPQPGFKKFFKGKKMRNMNKSLKQKDMILAFVLNRKKEFEGPILTKLYGGNFLVIRNQVYRYNPDAVLSFGKYKIVLVLEGKRDLLNPYGDLAKEIVEDYLSKNPGTKINVDDPVLIKAIILAKLTEKQGMKGSKWIWIILIIVGVIVGFFLLTSKKSPTPVPTTVIPTNITG